MTDFKHSCFISYRNGKRVDDIPVNDLLNSFSEQLWEALDSELRAYFDFDNPVFLDIKELKPGEFLLANISDALCRSLCLIAVYTPNYFSSKKMFCASELFSFLQREKGLFTKLGIKNPLKSLVITIRLRGKEERIPSLLKERLFYDFRSFSLAGERIIEHPVFSKKIEKIAEYISDIHEEFFINNIDLCADCDNFKIPDIVTENGKNEITEFINKVKLIKKPVFPGS